MNGVEMTDTDFFHEALFSFYKVKSSVFKVNHF